LRQALRNLDSVVVPNGVESFFADNPTIVAQQMHLVLSHCPDSASARVRLSSEAAAVS
jgi:hypothetical protein